MKILVLLIIISMTGMAKAQSSAQVTASATATVIVPITISKAADMALGSIVSAPTGGTMQIHLDGSRTFSNSSNRTANPAPGQPAEFTLTGDANCTFSVTHNGNGTGSSQNHFFLFNGTNTMAFDLDTPNSTGNVLTGGVADYLVTGTLTIGNNQVAGTYAGSWTEVVAYE